MSMSWLSGPLEQEFQDSITGNPNMLFVTIPSGNGGPTDADPDGANRMPCNLNSPNVLCVSTSSPTDGLDCGDFGATVVDVAVPTQGGLTTADGGGFVPTSCATSFAAPTAAGVATILFGLDPSATPAEVKSAIIDSARKVPAWSGKSVSGGIIDAEAAVTLFSQRRNIPLATPPAATPPPAPPVIPGLAPTPVSAPVRAPTGSAASLKVPGIIAGRGERHAGPEAVDPRQRSHRHQRLGDHLGHPAADRQADEGGPARDLRRAANRQAAGGSRGDDHLRDAEAPGRDHAARARAQPAWDDRIQAGLRPSLASTEDLETRRFADQEVQRPSPVAS